MIDGLPILPAGTTLPPAPYLVGTLLAAVAVVVALRRRPPTVTDRHVLALAPWMAVGAAAHALYVLGGLPPAVAPLGGSPTVYLVVGTAAGATWLAAAAAEPTRDRVPAALAVGGGAALAPIVAAALAAGLSPAGTYWSAVALAVAVPTTAAAWVGLTRAVPEAAVTGRVGALAVFGHALDGVSTAVGTTRLGFGERTPLSRFLLELGGLPSVPVLGDGWLFALVKLAVACGVTWLLAASVRETPAEGYLLIGFVAAVGLGPGIHNLLLFSTAG